MTNAEIQVFEREAKIPGTEILKSGWPDFLIMRPNEIFAIEVKRPTDKLSENQKRMHAALKRFGLRIEVEVVNKVKEIPVETERILEAQQTADFLYKRFLELGDESDKIYRRIKMLINCGAIINK